MTEAIENGTVLVRLRAVAMERDDNSDGWVPMGTGGLSNVCIVKRSIQLPDAPAATPPSSLPGASERGEYKNNNNNSRCEFIINAHKLNDGELVFRCIVCKDFKYNKVMPTFHNWCSGGERLGLVFLTAADARVFDRGIMSALVDLLAGMDMHRNESSDNEVFMTVELPYKPDNKRKPEGSSRHVSPTSTDSSSTRGTPSASESDVKPYRQKPLSGNEPNSLLHHQPSNVTVLQPHLRIQKPGYPPPSSQPPTISPSHLNPLESPVVTYEKPVHDHTELKHSLKGEKPVRLTCKHCRKVYSQEDNVRGSCEYAPDYVRSSIDTVTCIPCARTMVYHCMSDSEGNFAQPCDCDTAERGCAKRWLGLAILSILLPCLWCYPALKVCHLCGVQCGACGGRHEPLSPPSTATS